jgi:hypothetical protein
MVAKQLVNTNRLHFRNYRKTIRFKSFSFKGEMMRKRVFSAALACGLLAAMAAATAYAQLPGTTMRTTIPFDFSIRGKTLPAGVYEIRRVNDEPDVLLIANLNDRRERCAFNTEPVEARKILGKGVVEFHRYGDSYFLSEIFADGEQTGRELRRSRQERDMRREMASNQTEPETVALAAY